MTKIEYKKALDNFIDEIIYSLKQEPKIWKEVFIEIGVYITKSGY